MLFDYVGSGGSDHSAFDQTRYSTLKGYAADVLEIVDELDLDQVNFVGHSVSSMIGALAAIDSPGRFESLTMIGPSPCYMNDGEYPGGFDKTDIEALLESLESNHVAWSASMAPVIMGKENGSQLTGELEASFCRMDPFLAHHFARVTFLSDNRSDLPRLSVPTLILQCQKDVIAGLKVGEFVHSSIPNSQFVLMDATGHCPHLSAPEKVTAALKQFLETK